MLSNEEETRRILKDVSQACGKESIWMNQFMAKCPHTLLVDTKTEEEVHELVKAVKELYLLC